MLCRLSAGESDPESMEALDEIEGMSGHSTNGTMRHIPLGRH
jgi:hypothetical protein